MESVNENEEKVQARFIEKGDTIQYPSSWLVTFKPTDPVVPLQGEVLDIYTDATYIAFKTPSGNIKGFNRQKLITRVRRSTLPNSQKIKQQRPVGSTMVKCGSHWVSID